MPLVIRNAPTRLMKELHYGEGYQYAHDAQDKLTDMQCLPDSLQGRHYYVPTEQPSPAKFAVWKIISAPWLTIILVCSPAFTVSLSSPT